MGSIVDTHPQRATIIEGLLGGRSLRELASSVTPRVSHIALFRYRKKHILPTMDGATVLSTALKTLADAGHIGVVPLDPKQVTQAALLADPLRARIAKHQSTLDDALTDARQDKDARGVAALVSTDLKGLELDARLSGRLDSGPGATIQIVTPAVTINAAPEPAAAAEDTLTIDIGPGR